MQKHQKNAFFSGFARRKFTNGDMHVHTVILAAKEFIHISRKTG